MAKTIPQQLHNENFNNIPQELKDKKQWVVAKFEKRLDGKTNKIPYQINGKKASSTDSKTWTDFDTAVKFVASGSFPAMGFVLNNDYTGIDFDDCIMDYTIADWTKRWVSSFNSYAEYSFSKTGIHIILPGALLKDKTRRKKKGYECYDSGRFFVFTGNIIDNFSNINKAEQQFELFYKEVFGRDIAL